MAGRSIERFLSDEDGGVTLWALLWFMIMVAMCGLALDTTDAYRAQTMLQATADSAALAGAMALPEEAATVGTAIAYARANLPVSDYGEVLRANDVELGSWNHDLHIFTRGVENPDAVRVATKRTRAGDNPVPVNLLRIVGTFEWEVTTYAIAQRFIPDCLRDGLVARGMVDLASNNTFGGEICIHGEAGVQMQTGNEFADGVDVSMPDLEMLDVPADNTGSNPGLGEALTENRLDPRMVDHVDELIAALLARDTEVLPAWVDETDAVILRDDRFDFADLEAGRIYHIQCAANRNAGIPANTLVEGVVIVADCNIAVGAGVELHDVVLASRAGGNSGQGGSGNSGHSGNAGGAGTSNADITFAANAVLGADDDCQEGGGVQVFTLASLHFPSTTSFNGVQIVAGGDVDLGARDQGINGINVQAGGNITLTSNNAFGQCTGGAPQLFTVDYYRLVF